MKKLLFVSPDYGYFPLSAAFVVTTMRRAGIAYDLLDLHLQDDLKERVASGDYWGVATTGLVLDFKKVAEVLQTVDFLASDMVTILGGRISYAPSHLLEPLPLDFIVVGEAEETLPELVQAILSRQRDFSKIKGIMYRGDENRFVRTPNRKLQPLDTFEPTWDDIDMEYYISTDLSKNLWTNSFPLVTGMGCMGKCSFCLPGIRGVRVRPVQKVLREMQAANEVYDFSYYSFRSEVFYNKYEDVKAFCDGYRKSGLGKSWVCSMRVDFDTDLLPMMADVGVRYIFIGLESFDDQALKGMGKNTSMAMIDNFINAAQKCNIELIAGLMAGNMGDSPMALKRTVEYVNKKGVIAPSISPLCVYPGTKVYEFALGKELIKDEAAYCDSIFNNKWETTYFGPLYPNVTEYAMTQWWDAYSKCRYELETHVAIPLQSKGFDSETETTNCHNCGKPIQIVRGSVKAHVCKNCVTMNMVNIYLSMLKNEDTFARIRSAMLSANRIGVMGGGNFMKALLFIARELSIDLDRLMIVGQNANLIANVPTIDLADVTGKDTLLLAGLHCPEKVQAVLEEQGVPPRNIHNLTSLDYKRWLRRSIDEKDNFFEFTCSEDIEFFSLSIAEHLLVAFGKATAWAVLPAGGYGLSVYKGFSSAGTRVVALADSYKTAADLNVDIPVVNPTEVKFCGADKAFICTPVDEVQQELRSVLLNNGMAAVDIILLRDMYTKLWDRLLVNEEAAM